jgi:hypothetical protein
MDSTLSFVRAIVIYQPPWANWGESSGRYTVSSDFIGEASMRRARVRPLAAQWGIREMSPKIGKITLAVFLAVQTVAVPHALCSCDPPATKACLPRTAGTASDPLGGGNSRCAICSTRVSAVCCPCPRDTEPDLAAPAAKLPWPVTPADTPSFGALLTCPADAVAPPDPYELCAQRE